jgi:hypothetical protein
VKGMAWSTAVSDGANVLGTDWIEVLMAQFGQWGQTHWATSMWSCTWRLDH